MFHPNVPPRARSERILIPNWRSLWSPSRRNFAKRSRQWILVAMAMALIARNACAFEHGKSHVNCRPSTVTVGKQVSRNRKFVIGDHNSKKFAQKTCKTTDRQFSPDDLLTASPFCGRCMHALRERSTVPVAGFPNGISPSDQMRRCLGARSEIDFQADGNHRPNIIDGTFAFQNRFRADLRND